MAICDDPGKRAEKNSPTDLASAVHSFQPAHTLKLRETKSLKEFVFSVILEQKTNTLVAYGFLKYTAVINSGWINLNVNSFKHQTFLSLVGSN